MTSHACYFCYQAGLCSDQPLSELKAASLGSLSIPVELAPDRLSLALEPESASLYCHEMLKRGLVAPYCENPSGPYNPHSYILVDIGGGTVDISAHKVLKYDVNSNPIVEELHPPIGNACGGTRVNKEFVTFLERLVSDIGFSHFVDTCDLEVNIRNRCELNNLINVVFEEQKQMFGRLPKDKRKDAVIRFPVPMLEIYKEDLLDNIETVAPSDVKLIRQNLRISVNKMEEFFNPVVSGILSCIKKVIDGVNEGIDVIYLVGGFGGCLYLYQEILAEFGISYKCIVPPNPEYAVVEGSVLFCADPSVIHSRRADATYGKSVIRPFESKIHDKARKFIDENNMPFCHDLFQTIVEVGETVHPNDVYACMSIPSRSNQKNMCIELYQSPCKMDEVWYVQGERSGGAVKIGELVVDFGGIKGGGESREVEFVFDFSHTEIQVVAYDRRSGRVVKSVIDFLSVQSSEL